MQYTVHICFPHPLIYLENSALGGEGPLGYALRVSSSVLTNSLLASNLCIPPTLTKRQLLSNCLSLEGSVVSIFVLLGKLTFYQKEVYWTPLPMRKSGRFKYYPLVSIIRDYFPDQFLSGLLHNALNDGVGFITMGLWDKE